MRPFFTYFRNIPYILIICLTIASCKSTKYLKVSSTPNMIAIDSTILEDAAINKLIYPYKQRMDQQMNQVIGYSNQHLDKKQINGQSLVGNFFADALLAIGKKIDPEVIVAFATKGGIRSEIKEGSITIGNVFELMPFENYITILSYKGSQLQTLASFIAKTKGQPVANMQLVLNENEAVNFLINGQAIDPNKIYKLVTYDYLANGGDYVVGLENPVSRMTSNLRVREGLIEYIQKLQNNNIQINARIDERIKNLN